MMAESDRPVVRLCMAILTAQKSRSFTRIAPSRVLLWSELPKLPSEARSLCINVSVCFQYAVPLGVKSMRGVGPRTAEPR